MAPHSTIVEGSTLRTPFYQEGELVKINDGAGTPTAQLNANHARVANSDRADADINIMDWLGGARSARATEEVIGLGRYGKTLTVEVPEKKGRTSRQ